MIGTHLIIDIDEIKNDKLLCDIEAVEKVLSTAALMCGATILSSRFHEFGEGCGITGVLVLSSSHFSIHTWPEFGYAALDVFMCGENNPMDCMEYLLKQFGTNTYKYKLLNRGMMLDEV
jgi:S-adenosylmethionine decarboxylase